MLALGLSFCAVAAGGTTSLPPGVDSKVAGTAITDPYDISILLMGAGEQLFSRWGHIAIRVDDATTGRSHVFNHGTFDFGGREDLLAYAKGFLRFRLAVSSWRTTMHAYTQQDRDLWACPLQLAPEQEQRMVELLEENLLPANRYYAYRHYLDNCTTRTRDLVEAVAAAPLQPFKEAGETGHTFRHWTREHLMGTPVMRALILFSLGPGVDAPITRWQEHFLPDLLVEDLRRAPTESGVPLVSTCNQAVVRQGPPPPQTVARWEVGVIAALIVMVAFGWFLPLVPGLRLSHRRRLYGLGLTLWGLLGGMGGLGLVAFWLFTEHEDTWGNENLLAFLPVHLWLLAPGLKLLLGRELGPWVRYWLPRYFICALGLIVLAVLFKLGPLVQDNWAYLCFAVVANLCILVLANRAAQDP